MANPYRLTFQNRSVGFAKLFPATFYEIKLNLAEALDEFPSINIHSEGAALTWFLVSFGVVSFDDQKSFERLEEIRRFMVCYLDVRMGRRLDALNKNFEVSFRKIAMSAYCAYRMPAKRPRHRNYG